MKDDKKSFAYKLGAISAVVIIICLNVLAIAITASILMRLF